MFTTDIGFMNLLIYYHDTKLGSHQYDPAGSQTQKKMTVIYEGIKYATGRIR